MHFRNIHINFQAIALVFLNALLVFQLNAQPPGATYYWIGNGGNWTDPNHWSSVSGGAAGTPCHSGADAQEGCVLRRCRPAARPPTPLRLWG